jgi:transcriptional regulator
MYVPTLFQVNDPLVVEQFIKSTGLATLISKSAAFPTGTHIPLELETNLRGEKVLTGHLAKANPQWKEFEKDNRVLAIFLSSIHQYISSSWYNHPNVPTWNYMSVHLTGKVKRMEGDELWQSLKRLTHRYEQGETQPVDIENLPPSVKKQVNGIVGIEIRIEKIEAAFKISQNRNEEDYRNIIRALRMKNDALANCMAEVMEKKLANLKMS